MKSTVKKIKCKSNSFQKSAVMSFIAPLIVFLAPILTLVFLDPAAMVWRRVRRSPPVSTLFARLGLAGGGDVREETAMRTPPMPPPAERRSETGAPAGTTSSSDGKHRHEQHVVKIRRYGMRSAR